MTLRLGDAVCFVNAEGAKRGALVAQLLEDDRLDLVVLGGTHKEPAARRVEGVPLQRDGQEGAYYFPYPLQVEATAAPSKSTDQAHDPHLPAQHKPATPHDKAAKKK